MAQSPNLPPRWLRELDIFVGGCLFPLIALAIIALILIDLFL